MLFYAAYKLNVLYKPNALLALQISFTRFWQVLRVTSITHFLQV